MKLRLQEVRKPLLFPASLASETESARSSPCNATKPGTETAALPQQQQCLRIYLIWSPLISAAKKKHGQLETAVNLGFNDRVPEALWREIILGNGAQILMGFLKQREVFHLGRCFFQVIKKQRVLSAK